MAYILKRAKIRSDFSRIEKVYRFSPFTSCRISSMFMEYSVILRLVLLSSKASLITVNFYSIPGKAGVFCSWSWGTSWKPSKYRLLVTYCLFSADTHPLSHSVLFLLSVSWSTNLKGLCIWASLLYLRSEPGWTWTADQSKCVIRPDMRKLTVVHSWQPAFWCQFLPNCLYTLNLLCFQWEDNPIQYNLYNH